MVGRIVVTILIGSGLVAAAITLGGVFVYGCSTLLWWRDERRAERRLVQLEAQEAAKYQAAAQFASALADYEMWVASLPVADPWDVA